MKFKESEKAIRAGEVLRGDKPTTNPMEIGTALLEETNVVGVFHDPEHFKDIHLLNVYRLKSGILFNMVLLPNRDLHLMRIEALTDEEYANTVANRILAENEVVFFDEDSLIDVRKAHVPDSPNADQIRDMLKA